MDESTYTLRHAKADDAPAIRRLTRKVWLATYPHPLYKVTAEDIAKRFDLSDAAGAIENIRHRLGTPREGEENFVVTFSGEVIGYCRGVRKKGFNELEILNVLPCHHRRGIGTRLWQRANSSFDPKKPTLVRVVVYNAPAIAFYRSVGFENLHEYVIDDRFRLPNREDPNYEATRCEKNGVLMVLKHMLMPTQESAT